MPSVSVIVPTYRREEALCKMLRTLLSQDFDDMEILLIDQTPKHNEETVEFLATNANRIRQVLQQIPNLPMARNNGLSLALGKFIVYIDDDVLLPVNCIGQLVSHLAKGATDGVTGLINFDKSIEEVRQQYQREHGAFDKHAKNGLLFVPQFIGAVMAFRREVFDVIGGFDERLGVLSSSASGEDYEFCRRAKRASFQLAIDTNLVIHHPLGVSGGCAAREAPPDVARTRHMRSGFYIEMKFAECNGRIGFNGWIRMLRGWVVNREMLKSGAASMLGNLRELRGNYKIVQKFYSQTDTDSGLS